jgi:arylsulfatase
MHRPPHDPPTFRPAPRGRRAIGPGPAALLGAVLAGCGGTPPPSVALITIDTLRADHLGCYGYRRATSPGIDRLAAGGALFEHATATVPRTTQSIASILTGRFPKGHGARGLFSILSEANVTLAEILRARGFRTAAFTSNMFLTPEQGFAQGFEVYDNPQRRWSGDSAGEVTAAALSWLDRHPPDAPFFLWVHYLDPHWSYQPSPPFDRMFDPEFDDTLTIYEDLALNRLTKGSVIFENRLERRHVDHLVALYDGEIAQVDRAIAPLLDRLAGIGRPVLTVLTSDHGESLGEHGYHFAHGEYLYEPELRIPLLFHLPGRIPAGLRAAEPAQTIDVAPTILGLIGIDGLQAVDGRPLLLPGPTPRPAPGRALLFAETDFQLIHPENRRWFLPGPAGKWSAASDGRFKLIHIPGRDREMLELYDLQSDPGETRDLSGAAAAAEIRARLLRELKRFVDYDAGSPVLAAPDRLDPEWREGLRSLGYVN